MHFQGKVVHQRFAAGSKSDHPAVVLQTPEGAWKLRRVGGNPFHDPELDKLVGHEILAEGQLHQGQLILTQWQVLTPQ
jgi:hypothetical protein